MTPEISTVLRVRYALGLCLRILEAGSLALGTFLFLLDLGSALSSNRVIADISWAWALRRSATHAMPCIALGVGLLVLHRWLVAWIAPWPRHVCPQCGYSLAGHAGGPCPECGCALPRVKDSPGTTGAE